jgi:hypothetical protein
MRPYFALGAALRAFSIAFVALKIAYSLEIARPVLVRPSSSCTVHFQPVGVVCLDDLILDAPVLHEGKY